MADTTLPPSPEAIPQYDITSKSNADQPSTTQQPVIPVPTVAFNPRPAVIDFYNKVVGNQITGSNPGSKPNPLNTSSNPIKDSNDWKDTLFSSADQFTTPDYTKNMKPFTYNGDYDGTNFERYYNSPGFKKLGYDPYRDNESLYNNNMSTGDEFVRAAGQWVNLIGTGFSSGIRAWKTMFTDPLAPDLQGSKEMARAMAIGSSSKGGAEGFMMNTFLNSGYTLGIGGEMLGETLAIAGVTALAGGTDIEATLPLWMTRMAGGAAKVAKGAEVLDELKGTTGINGLKSFWDNNKVGQMLGKAGDIMNPLENTWNVAKNLATGPKEVGTINQFAKWSKNFGEFAKDLTLIKAGVSEAQLEGGTVQIDLTKDLINKYKQDHQDSEPTGKDLAEIENLAKQESHRTAFWNLPAIMWSNKFMYETMFAPFEKTAKKGMENVVEDVLYKKGEGFSAVKEGFAGKLQRVKALVTSPRELGKFGYEYLKENAAEGIQENLQDGISNGAKAHAIAIYNNPDRKSYEGYMGHFLTGMTNQLNASGAQTFLGGFIMASMAHPFMASAMWAGEGVWNNTVNKGDHKAYQAQRDAQIKDTVESLNEFYKDPAKYLAPDMVNAVKQGTLQKDFYKANQDNNRKKAEDSKANSLFEHLYTALKTDKFDILLDKFKDMKNLSSEDMKTAFKVEDGDKALGMMDSLIERAHNIKDNFEDIKSSYPNPFDPFRYKKDSEERAAQHHAYAAWEDATQNLVFAKSEFDNHNKRIQQLADTLITTRNPIKNANAQDLFVLMDRGQMKETLKSLKNDVKAISSDNADGRKIIAEKTKRIDLLTKLGEGFELSRTPQLESAVKINDKTLKNNFKDYINHISKDSGDIVFNDQLDHALNLIKDNYTLRDERGSLVRSINVINNPKGFLALHKSLVATHKEIANTKIEETKKRSDLFVAELQHNNSKNQLAKEAGVYLTPEYSLELEKALKKGEELPSPTSFVDSKSSTLAEISDPKDPKFIKAKAVWDKISQAIQATNAKPKIATIESLTKERDDKLTEIKVDLTKANVDDKVFDKEGRQYSVVGKGVDLKGVTLERVEQGSFGTEDYYTGEQMGEVYTKDPNPIIKEYDKKITDLGKVPVTGETSSTTGKLIYATKGSGKSTWAKEHPEDYVDADELLVNEIKKLGITIPEGQSPQDTIFEFAKNVSKTDKDALYDRVRNQIKDLIANGKNVLTGTTDFIKDANVVYQQTDNNKIGITGYNLVNLKERENNALEASGKTGIQTDMHIGDILTKSTNIVSPTSTPVKETIPEVEKADSTIYDTIDTYHTYIDKIIQDRMDKFGISPTDLFKDYTDTIDRTTSRAMIGVPVDVVGLNEAIDYYYKTYNEITRLKKPFAKQERINKSLTSSYLSELQNELEQTLNYLIDYETAIKTGDTLPTFEYKTKSTTSTITSNTETETSPRNATEDAKIVTDLENKITTVKEVHVSNEQGIKTGKHPSVNLIKKGVKLGFTKEDIIDMPSEEREQVKTATSKEDVTNLLNKYKTEPVIETSKIPTETVKADYTKVGVTLNNNALGTTKGTHVTFNNLPEGIQKSYIVYTKVEDGETTYNLAGYNAPEAPIASSAISEEDVIQKAFEELSKPVKEETPVATINVEDQVKQIKKVKTFKQFDTLLDDLVQKLTTEPMESTDTILKAFEEQKIKLKTTNITSTKLNEAIKKGWNIVIGDKIYTTFEVNGKDKTVTVKSPFGTSSEVFNISDVKEITSMKPIETPVEVSFETKDQIKDIIATGSEVISSNELKSTFEEAKSSTNASITKEFLNNLGCK